MARIRNQKQSSSRKLSDQKKATAKAETVEGSSDEENLITESHQTDDPTLVTDVSAFLKDLHTGSPKKKRSGKANEDASPRPADRLKPKEEKSSNKDQKIPKKGPREAKDSEVPPSKSNQARFPAKFVFPPTPQWYSVLPPLPATTNIPKPTPTQTSSLLSKAASLHATDVQSYTASGVSTGSSSDGQFLQKVLQSGTLSDRLSAMTLLVQGSPVHNVKSLDSLKNMAGRGKGKGGREESLKALRCIIDWWAGGGAPDRKLKYFLDQPLLHPKVTGQHLLAWYFEDWLKKYFFSVLEILENLVHDPLPYVRTQTITLLFTLLRDKPEQEQNLLRLLVNKLGDLEKSISSRVSYHLLQLLQTHPSMKGIVVREIVSLILKPRASTAAASLAPYSEHASSKSTKIVFSDSPSTSTSNPPPKPTKEDKKAVGTSHARYYAAITFNQIVLSPSQADREVARELINIYFELFKDILGQGDVDLEDGMGDASNAKQIRDDSLKGKSKKQKGKEVKGDAGFTELEDSNSKLISAVLTGVNRALPFAKLDTDDPRLKKHLDTLFLITHKSTFNITLQALLLIHQISLTASSASSSSADLVTDRFYRTLYASLYDPRLSTSSKQAMYLNLLFKCIKSDKNLERAKAFVRRFTQILASGGGGGAEFTAGGLHLLGELFDTVPGLREMLGAPTKRKSPKSTEDKEEDEELLYDPRKREPEFSNASGSPLWELLPLLSHYHPTVSLHARQLLLSQPLTSTPDLALNTLSHFLDRFVYKNPKKQNSKQKGSSAMQPAAGDAVSGGGVRLIKGEVGDGLDSSSGGGVTVNNEKWWKRRVEDVPIDQVFFHKYFNQKNELEKARAVKAKKRRKGKDDDESSEVGSDVGEDREKEDELDEGGSEKSSDDEEGEIWTAMKASMPKELDISEGEDSIPSDLDEGDEDDSLSDIEYSEKPGDDAEEPSEDDDEDDDKFSLVELSDAEDLIPLDEAEAMVFQDGVIEWPGDESDLSEGEDEDEEWTGFGNGSSIPGKKRKRNDGEVEQKKRKKVRSLPTFASYEDYAKLIEEGPEDEI